MKENKVWSAIINFSWFVNLKGINLEINLILIIFSGFFLFCIKIMNAWLSSWIFPNYFAKLLNRISHHLYQQLKKNCRIVCCKPIKCLFWCNIIFFFYLWSNSKLQTKVSLMQDLVNFTHCLLSLPPRIRASRPFPDHWATQVSWQLPLSGLLFHSL